MFMTRSLDVMPKTTEQNLIVRSGKYEAEATVTDKKDCARGIVLLKLTRQKASRGLSAAVCDSRAARLTIFMTMSCNRLVRCSYKICTRSR